MLIKLPSHDLRYIHRFQSLQEASQRSPSHDLSTLSTFQSLQKEDEGVIRTRGPGPAGPPDTLAHALLTSLYIVIALDADAPSSPEGRRISYLKFLNECSALRNTLFFRFSTEAFYGTLHCGSPGVEYEKRLANPPAGIP